MELRKMNVTFILNYFSYIKLLTFQTQLFDFEKSNLIINL